MAPAVIFIVACYRRGFEFVRCCAFGCIGGGDSCGHFDGGAIAAAVPVVIFFVVAAPLIVLILAITYLIMAVGCGVVLVTRVCNCQELLRSEQRLDRARRRYEAFCAHTIRRGGAGRRIRTPSCRF